MVKEWLARHRQFRLVFLPAYSPNLNLIERLWKFLRKEALNRWHKTFEEMQGAVADVLDHLERYRTELDSLMSEKFHILKDEDLTAIIKAVKAAVAGERPISKRAMRDLLSGPS